MKISKAIQIFLLIALLIMGGVLTSTAHATAKVTIVNRSGSTIVAGYFSYPSSNKWGSDQLTKLIPPGGRHTLTFNGTGRFWDCKFVLRNGGVRYKYKLDVMSKSILYVD